MEVDRKSNLELTEMFMSYLVQKRKSENTIKNYRSTMNIFDKWLEGKSFLDVKECDIDCYINEKIEDEIKPATINRAIATYRTFYEFLLNSEIISKMPTKLITNVSDEEEKEIKFFSKEELRQIIDNVKKELKTCDIDNRKFAYRNLALLRLGMNTGLRISEICSLTTDRIDLEKRTIKIINTKGKRNHTVSLNPDVYKNIVEYLKYRDEFPSCSDYVFVTKSGNKLAQNRVNDILSAYNNVEGKTDYSFHSLRHSYATILFENEVPIEEISKALNHSSINLTYSIYIHFKGNTTKHYSIV